MRPGRRLCQVEAGSSAAAGVTAAMSSSPVRMRRTFSTGTTKILPSPTSPVCAAELRSGEDSCQQGSDQTAEAVRRNHIE